MIEIHIAFRVNSHPVIYQKEDDRRTIIHAEHIIRTGHALIRAVMIGGSTSPELGERYRAYIADVLEDVKISQAMERLGDPEIDIYALAKYPQRRSA